MRKGASYIMSTHPITSTGKPEREKNKRSRLHKWRRKINDHNPIKGEGMIWYCHAKCEHKINSKHFIQMIRENPINFQSYNFIHKMATQFIIIFNFHKNHLQCFSINSIHQIIYNAFQAINIHSNTFPQFKTIMYK